MDWGTLEAVKAIVLVALAIGLHQLIRRFGTQYAAAVFESTPQPGRHLVALADYAYYLIFAAYILFNHRLARHRAGRCMDYASSTDVPLPRCGDGRGRPRGGAARRVAVGRGWPPIFTSATIGL
ncbi:MAG: hypothetical protein M3N68_09540 [Actinomycetota bacterium]|nr:hypothetical protein [Actinomycetota bacterium]